MNLKCVIYTQPIPLYLRENLIHIEICFKLWARLSSQNCHFLRSESVDSFLHMDIFANLCLILEFLALLKPALNRQLNVIWLTFIGVDNCLLSLFSILMGKVIVLPEVEVTDSLEGARLSSHNRVRLEPVRLEASPAPLGGEDGVLRRRRKRKLSAANLTWWPPWVYEMYDCVSFYFFGHVSV